MNKSFISKYFDFSQALEFLKDGLSVTNTNYVSHFRILLKDNKSKSQKSQNGRGKRKTKNNEGGRRDAH